MPPSSSLSAPRARKQPAQAVKQPLDWARLKLPCCYLMLLALTLAVYGQMARGVYFFWPGTQFAFIGLDDGDYFTQNPHIKRGLTWEGVRWAFTENFSANWHPLTWTSLMLDSQLYQGQPGGPHVTNLLLHLASVLLLFTLVRRLTGELGPSVLVAALWAVHPLHAESVAWVSERKDTLSTCFAILALVFYERYARRPAVWRYLLVAATYGLSLLSKQMWVTFPCVLILLDYWPMGRIQFRRLFARTSAYPPVDWRFLALEKAPFFAMAIGFSAMIFIVQRDAGAVASLEGIPLSMRLGNVVVSYWMYIYKTFWPTDLGIMYPFPANGHRWYVVAGAAAPLLLITAVAVANWRRWPWLIVGWLWYLGTLVPVVGLVQIGGQSWADRYAYVPHIGMFLGIVWMAGVGVQSLSRRLGPAWAQRVAVGAALLATMAMTVRGRQQVALWEDTETLFAHTVAVTQNNYSMVTVLASYLDANDRLEEAKHYYRMAIDMDPYRVDGLVVCANSILNHDGEVKEAMMLLERALKIDPDDPGALLALGAAYIRQERYDEAVEVFGRVPSIEPRRASFALISMAIAESGRQDADPEKVDQYIRQAVEADDTDPSALRVMASFCLQKGELDRAEELYQRTLRYAPNDVSTMLDLGVVYVRRGELQEAMQKFREAVRLRPRNADARNRLAGGLMAMGNVPQAIAEYQEAIKLRPDWPGPMNDLAWILATDESPAIRSGGRAVQLAEKACELRDHADASLLDTLAVAYAEVGRWDDARRTIRKAIEIATAQGDAGLVAELTEHSELFEKRLPLRARPQEAAEAIRLNKS